jgi:hypothetical protein
MLHKIAIYRSKQKCVRSCSCSDDTRVSWSKQQRNLANVLVSILKSEMENGWRLEQSIKTQKPKPLSRTDSHTHDLRRLPFSLLPRFLLVRRRHRFRGVPHLLRLSQRLSRAKASPPLAEARLPAPQIPPALLLGAARARRRHRRRIRRWQKARMVTTATMTTRRPSSAGCSASTTCCGSPWGAALRSRPTWWRRPRTQASGRSCCSDTSICR